MHPSSAILIRATVMGLGYVAPAQVRFQQAASVVRCEMRNVAMTVVGQWRYLSA